MIKFKSTTLAAAVLGLSLCISGVASATIPGSAPAADAPQSGTPDQLYEQNHHAALAALTQLKTILASPKVAPSMTQLATELAKLPGLKAAYLDAKKSGKEDEAKTALEAYTQSANTIIELALPLEQLVQMDGQDMAGFDQLGPVGAKLKAEVDIAAVINEIDTAMKPLNDANDVVGPLQIAAATAMQARMKEMAPKIFGEELATQVEKALNGEPAK